MTQPDAAQLFVAAVDAYEKGDIDLAMTSLEAVLKQQPAHGGALFMSGSLLLARGQATHALGRLEAAVHALPTNGEVLQTLGETYHKLQRWPEAVAAYRAAWQQGRRHLDLLNNLGLALKETGDLDGAVSAYQEALKHAPDDADLHNNLAIALNSRQDYSGAIDEYRRSIEIDPSSTGVWSNLAMLYEQSNMLDEAEDALGRGLKLDPTLENLQLIAARCERRRGELDRATQRLEPQLLRSGIDSGVRRSMEFELGRDYDLLGNAEQAFAHFTAGNALTPEVWPALRGGADVFLARLAERLACSTPSWFKELPISPPEDRPSPAFLVGFPRSGTTLMDTMLDAHPDISIMEELPMLEMLADGVRSLPDGYPQALTHLTQSQILEMRAAYWREADRHIGEDRRDTLILDKNPFCSAHAGFIRLLFPGARFIFALRHPCDVTLSCFMQAFGNNAPLENFRDLQTTALTYQRVMDLWIRYRRHLTLPVHEIRYEALVADKRKELESLLQFLGLGWMDGLEDHTAHAKKRGRIYTPSYHQVIRPVYGDAIGRWQRYRKHFGIALDTLKPYVETFGYSLHGD